MSASGEKVDYQRTISVFTKRVCRNLNTVLGLRKMKLNRKEPRWVRAKSVVGGSMLMSLAGAKMSRYGRNSTIVQG